MTEEKALEDAERDFEEKFPFFDVLEYVAPKEIVKGRYKPISCYAITLEGSCVVTDFLVTLVARTPSNDYLNCIYTIYDQSLGKKGIYKFI